MAGAKVIVVDTHVIIWDALKPELLSTNAKSAIAEANEGDGIVFCEISLWEIAMLIKKARLSIDASYQDFIKLVFCSNNYQFKGITPEIAELSTSLPEEVNQDPADRIISATSIIYKIPLVTTDYNLLNADSIETIW